MEELVGEQDVVIKPLADHVCESRGLAGSTILGDGTIALVLDVIEVIEDVISRQRQFAATGIDTVNKRITPRLSALRTCERISEPMGQIIAIVSQKGGVGKTSTAVNLGACISAIKRKVSLDRLGSPVRVGKELWPGPRRYSHRPSRCL